MISRRRVAFAIAQVCADILAVDHPALAWAFPAGSTDEILVLRSEVQGWWSGFLGVEG